MATVKPDHWKAVKLGYSHFLEMFADDFFYDDFGNFCILHGIVVKPTGVWVEGEPYTRGLLPQEYKIFFEHPDNDLSKPLVSFPMDFYQIERLLNFLSDPVDPEVMQYYTEFWQKHAPTDSVIQQGAIPQRTPKRQVQQEDEILQTLRNFGHDPLNLLEDRRGSQTGIKVQVREELFRRLPWLFGSNEVFNKAWHRLSKSKQIIRPPAPKP